MTFDRRAFVQGAAGAAAWWALAGRGHGAKPAATAPDAVVKTIDKQLPQAIERIQRWIRQPSVSATGYGVKECHQLTMELLREAGFQTVKGMPTKGHPGVFATLDAGAKRTLALYFMYDVQPVEEKEWASPPWKAAIIDHPELGKAIMGRGAVNQKGPEAAFLAAVHAIRGAGLKPPVNLVVVAEGEEEEGSPNFAQVVHKPEVVKALKRSEGVLMPSATQNPSGLVDLSLGAKGIVYIELSCDGARWGRGPRVRDIHSSVAAIVDAPVWRLIDALKTLRGSDGNEPAIDGITEHVRPTTAFEKRLYDEITSREDGAEFKKEIGVDKWINDLGERAMWERFLQRPTINIDGIYGGYTGEGSKTILPKKATAKVDIRLVPNMTARDVLAKLRKHLDKRGFTDIDIRDMGSYDPNETSYDARLTQVQVGYYQARQIPFNVVPRGAGSWPGYLFTGKPVSRPAGHFGLGYGQGAHSKDEIYVIEPKPGAKVQGLSGAIRSFADFLYALA